MFAFKGKTMKPLALAALTVFAAIALAQIPDGINPHEGIRIRTPWNHKGTKRYQPPKAVVDAYNAMLHTWATDGNLDRPVKPEIFIALTNARRPDLVESWEIVEYAQIERQPLGGGKVRYNWVDNGRDLPQRRIFLPPTYAADGTQTRGPTYTVERDFDADRNEFRTMATPGQFNRITHAKSFTIHPLGKMDLGPDFSVGRPGVQQPRQLSLGGDYIVESHGKKYLRVNGKLGIPLESLD
jgi:hypothetical protein